jgi:hypothetical protein
MWCDGSYNGTAGERRRSIPAALRDRFVVLTIDPSLDFAVPKRCMGGDGPYEAFKRFIDRRAALGSAPRS